MNKIEIFTWLNGEADNNLSIGLPEDLTKDEMFDILDKVIEAIQNVVKKP